MFERVVKLGGSTLSRTGSVAQFINWYRQQPERLTLLTVGGGWLADSVRHWQQFRFDKGQNEEAMHFRAIEAMMLNMYSVATEIGCAIWEPGKSPPMAAGIAAFQPMNWAKANRSLPRNWTVTSDSIAAQLAIELCAPELVLFKSRLANQAELQQRLSNSEIVDDHFSRLIDQIPRVRIVATSDDGIGEQWVSDRGSELTLNPNLN
ncbi:MAG: hypothetical protein R3C03_03245 [Pirellulaceae bacterium]